MNYSIRQMRDHEIEFPISQAHKEGWNPGISDGPIFYNADPSGYFVAELDGAIVGCISAVAYDEAYGFVGFYIVLPEHRGKGIGMALGKRALEYMGNRNIGIDGVVEQQENYKTIGFKFAYNNIRYSFLNPDKAEPDIRATEINENDLNALCEFDETVFPSKRREFLRDWISAPTHTALGLKNGNEFNGYITIRECYSGYKIGPLFAKDVDMARNLLNSALEKVPARSEIFMDIPDTNTAARDLISEFQMTKVFETARMYLKEEPQVAMDRIFGVTTFELG